MSGCTKEFFKYYVKYLTIKSEINKEEIRALEKRTKIFVPLIP